MSTKLPDIGGVPSSVDGELRKFLGRLSAHVQELRGFSGDRAGRASAGGGTGGGTAVIIPGAPAPPPAGPADPPDLTPPPTPTGVSVVAGIDFIGITTDAPVFTQGHGYARTRVYGIVYDPGPGPTPNPLPTFGSALLQHEFVGEVGSFPTEPAQQWHIWVKWLTRDGVESAIPAGDTNGFTVTTGQDIDQLLEILTGQITESQLFSALGARIDLIDGSMPGSVNARVASEAATRAAADSANAASISTVNARLNSGGDVAGAIVTVQTAASAAQSTADSASAAASAVASQVTTLQSVVTNSGSNALRNTSFEIDSNGDGLADDWTAFTGGAGDGSRVLLTTRPASLFGSGQSQRLQISSASNANDSGILQSLSGVSQGQKWTGSVYVRSNTAKVQLLLRAINGSSASIADFSSSPTVAGAPPARLSVSMTAPANTVRIEAMVRGINTNGEWFECDSIQLEPGDAVTGYKPGSGDVGALVASVQQEISTRASETGYLGAQYTLRLTAGNIVGGFGISGTSAPGAQPTIDFGIRANRFFVAAPEGVAGVPSIVPFTVQATPVFTPAGEFLPAGVYMDAAYIRNLEAVLGRFTNAFITNAMIVSLAVDKITAGSLSVGSYIQSSAYTPGGFGFRLGGDGYVEIANVGRTRVFNLQASGTQPVLRVGNAVQVLADGTANFAGDISSNNANLRGSLRGGAFSAWVWPDAGGIGFYLGPEGLLLGNFNNGRYLQVTADGNIYAPNFTIINGNVSFNGSGTFSGALNAATGTFAGALSAATGTFAGSLSAATGTFAGTLTAGAVNAVNTINLAGNAVTIPGGDTLDTNTNVAQTEVTVLTISLNAEGQPVYLHVAVAHDGQGSVPALGSTVTYRVKNNGVTERQFTLSARPNSRSEKSIPVYIPSPGAGSRTYTVTAQNSPGGGTVTAIANETVLFALGTKR